MKDIKELRAFLIEKIQEIDQNNLDYNKARSISMLTDKVLTSIALELKNAKLREEKPNIQFFNY